MRKTPGSTAPAAFPPTVLLWIKDECAKAMQPIETGFTVDEEVQVMLSASREARRLLSAATGRQPMPELEAAIAEREQRIAAEQSALLPLLPTEFHSLVSGAAAAAGQPMKPRDYFERDLASRKVAILIEYCRMEQRMGAAQMAQGAGGAGAAPAAASRGRLQQPAAELFDSIRLESFEALDRAERLLLQIKQNVYTADLCAELTKQPPAASIAHQPARIESRRPARFTLHFDRRELVVAGAA